MRLIVFALFSLAIRFSLAQNLEQFLSHPIESNFASSADGKNIAWVINDHGKRNVMIKIGNELPKLFTDFQQDDGQEIYQLAFSPNGTKLVLSEAVRPMAKGNIPIPQV